MHKPLQEVVFDLVAKGMHESPEFLDLIQWFGKEKLRKLFLEEQEKRRQEAARKAQGV